MHNCGIMYLMGGLDRYNRPIYRSIQRSIHRAILDRVSVEIRLSIRRYIGGVSTDVSTDSPLNDIHGVGRHIDMVYRSTIGYISVNCRSSLGRHSTDTCISTDTIDRYIDRYYRPIYRPILDIIIQQIVTLSKYGHDALDICHP